MATERVVVVGASAGGVSALEALVEGLPQDFPAPVLIVLHMAPTQRPLLAPILSAASVLPAAEAVDGEPLEAGRIYVAAPDHHLAIDGQRVRVARGPEENHMRPSIDVLFRSAAYYFGSRAIGVVLTGKLSDGTFGLMAIRRLGGLAMIQDPDEALYSEMPLAAMRRVDVDYSLPVSELPHLLAAAVQESPRPEPADAAHYRRDLKLEIDASAVSLAAEKTIVGYGEPSVYTCPECSGVLFRVVEGGTLDRFRCYTGHGFTTPALLEELAQRTEAVLWQTVKCLKESRTLLVEASVRMREAGEMQTAEWLENQIEEIEQRLETLHATALASRTTGSP